MDQFIEPTGEQQSNLPAQINSDRLIPNSETENISSSKGKNSLLILSVLLLFIFIVSGTTIILLKNRGEENTNKQVATMTDNETDTSLPSSSFEEIIPSNSTNTPTSLPSLSITKKPTSTSPPKPTNTQVPATDLQLIHMYINGQYSSPTNTSYNSQGFPDTYTYEEHSGTNAFYVAETIKNNSQNIATNIKRQLWINGKLESEKTIEKLGISEEKNYTDFYLPQSPGTYTIEIKINPNSAIVENNYTNNQLTRTYIITADKTSPTIHSIDVSRNMGTQQTCIGFVVSDNISTPSQMKYYESLDFESLHEITWDFSKEIGYQRCLSGPAGESHNYSLKVTDNRGNTSEKTLTFQLLSF